MKFCPNCGAALMGGAASFCSECGVSLKQTSKDTAIQMEEANPVHMEPDPASEVEGTEELTSHSKESAESPIRRRRKQKERHKLWKKPKPKPLQPDTETSADTISAAGLSPLPDDGYDGYYEDIVPIDEGQRRTEKLDSDMLKRAALIAGGALLIIVAAVVALLAM